MFKKLYFRAMEYTDGLNSERLTTRFLTEEDAAVWAEFFADPINSTFLPFAPDKSKEELGKEMIDSQLLRYREKRLGLQALLLKDTNEFIGLCGVLVQYINNIKEIEVGYHLLRRFWGKGYATEAAQLFRDYGFNTYQPDSIISIIHPLNFPSRAVAKRNGMQLDLKAITFKDAEYDVFRITSDKWKGLY